METRDWSLVVFTVLTQAAVGAFLVLQVLRYVAAPRAARAGARATRRGPDAGRARGGAQSGGPEAAPPRDDGPRPGGARGDGPEAGGAWYDDPRPGGARGDGAEAGGAWSRGHRAPVPAAVVLAVLSAGLFAALFHLSTPLQAARAVVNFSSSWLSREIVFGSLFAALLGLLAAQERRAANSTPASSAQKARKRRAAGPAPAGPAAANSRRERRAAPAGPAAATWLPHLTAAAGIAFLCCQTAIYLLPAQPAWNSFATPAAFGGTALRLGILGVAAGLVVRGPAPGGGDAARPAGSPGPAARNLPPADTDPTGPGMSSATVRGLVLAGLAALALEFFVLPLHLAELAADASPAAAASAQRLTGSYGGVLLLRLGLLAAAAAALGGIPAVIRGPARSSGRRLAAALACGAFGLVVVSEVCGRFLFYAMQVRVGI